MIVNAHFRPTSRCLERQRQVPHNVTPNNATTLRGPSDICGPKRSVERVQEVIANTYVAFSRLAQLGKEDLAFATPLAAYGVKQVYAGRRVGTSLNQRDVMSPANRQVSVESLDGFDWRDGAWKEALIEDRKAGPAEIAAARIDVAAWFRSLARKKRRIAQSLAQGESTSQVARLFGLTAGRISQLRQELAQSWAEFQGTAPT